MNHTTVSLLVFSLISFSTSAALATGDWAEAPKGLDYYLDRLPAKSLAQLIQEKKDAAAIAQEDSYATDESTARWRVQQIVESAGKASRSDAIDDCDELLASLRLSPALSPGWTNLVHDLRDCLSDPQTTDAEALGYCEWRRQLGPFAGQLSEEQLADVTRRLAAAGGRTAAHYRYLIGASEFFTYDSKSNHGGDDFASIVAQFPDHPRSETALFMTGRAALDSSAQEWGEPPSTAHLDLAETAFREYLKLYPEGRFVGDVLGWLGGVAVKREAWADALQWYLRQLDVPDHPENTRSATRMIERIMAIVLARPDEAPLVDIAARPEVAMGTVYWILHAPEANLYNKFYDLPEVVKRWRSHWLPRLANAISQNEAAWRDHDAMPWFVAIQAHAASDAGNQPEALALVDAHPDLLDTSDDLAFIRAVILQRSGDAQAAVSACREFVTAFPDSPLRPGAIFRLATALQDAGKSADAVAVLLQLAESGRPQAAGRSHRETYFGADFYPVAYGDQLPPAASALSPDLTLAEVGQVRQYLDTLLQFAPIEELARIERMQPAIDPAQWEKIRVIILGRALSEQNADIAATFAGREHAGIARQISQLAETAERDPSAEAFLALGNAWQNARGQLTAPGLLADRAKIYVEEFTEAPETLRLANAATVGFASDTTDRILAMDELWNAVQAWEKAAAAAAPGSPVQAKALAAILDALPRIAMATPFARRFAVENGWNEWADNTYRQLTADCPGTPETIAAARPFFQIQKGDEADPQPDPALADPFDQVQPGWTNRLYGFRQNYTRHREFLYGSLLKSKASATARPGGNDGGYQDLLDRLYTIDGGSPLDQLRPEMEALRQQSRQIYRHWNDACIHYAIEDLADLVLSGSPPDAGVRSRYFTIRLHVINVMAWHTRIDLKRVHPSITRSAGPKVDDWVAREVSEALADPGMKPVADRLDCLRLFILANRQISLPVLRLSKSDDQGETTIETRDYAQVEEGAKQFLAAYPDSSKRESVWLLCLRAAYRCRRPLFCSEAAAFPDNPFIAARYIRKTHPNQLPWDPQPVEAAIQAYRAEYANPSYPGELHDLKAALAFRKEDWPSSLSHTLAILENPQFVDLHSDALMRLSNIFALLAERDDRPAVLGAIKSNPAAQPYLRDYLDETDASTWELQPLRFVSPWLREQFNFPAATD